MYKTTYLSHFLMFNNNYENIEKSEEKDIWGNPSSPSSFWKINEN